MRYYCRSVRSGGRVFIGCAWAWSRRYMAGSIRPAIRDAKRRSWCMTKLLRLGVSALLLTVIGMQTDWPAVGHSFARMNFSYWALGIVILIGAQVISAWRW